MKIYNQSDFDALARSDDGCLYCPSGDWSAVDFGGADRLVFDGGCKFDDGCKFGDYCAFGVCCTFGGGCTFGACCSFGPYCTFGVYCAFNDGCAFDDSCKFNGGCEFGNRYEFGNRCKFDGYCKFGNQRNLENGTVKDSDERRSENRLTIPDVKVDEHTTRRAIIDCEKVREYAMEFYWKLKHYEDSGLTPEQVAEMAAELERVKRERDAAVRDLRDNAQRSCYVCKHWENGRCISPNKNECAGFNWWHWRGPFAENTGGGGNNADTQLYD